MIGLRSIFRHILPFSFLSPNCTKTHFSAKSFEALRQMYYMLKILLNASHSPLMLSLAACNNLSIVAASLRFDAIFYFERPMIFAIIYWPASPFSGLIWRNAATKAPRAALIIACAHLRFVNIINFLFTLYTSIFSIISLFYIMTSLIHALFYYLLYYADFRCDAEI